MRLQTIAIALLAALFTCCPIWADDNWQPQADPNNLRDSVTAQIVQHYGPAIVSITANKIVTAFYNPFAGMYNMPQEEIPIGRAKENFLGSGFIIQKDGYVVTNNHVIDQAQSISVTLSNGQTFSAHLIGSSSTADLAVLKIDSNQTFPTIPLGTSSDLMIGEPAIAVGNPFGYAQSVSSGIVSAIGREIDEPDNPTPLKNLIQTDAAINPGNSGGPLLDAYGRVIGINTAIRQSAENIGFAIGVDQLTQILPQLMSPATTNQVQIPAQVSAIRTGTEPNGPHEIIVLSGTNGPAVTSIDGQATPTLVDACADLLNVTLNQKTVTVGFSDGTQKTFAVSAVPPSPIVLKAKQELGISVVELTPALSAKYQLPIDNGLLIQEVDPNSVSSNAGLQPGDVLVGVGGNRIRTLDDLGALLPLMPQAKQVRFDIVRNGQIGYGVLEFN
ncbi:MAG TPA: trypsin-like peptidase domain-containing protein [Phycisphaerae bacterium]|nr:trypsin-like peptidase domain-containing protein [Phycisphaerae bacterium]